MQGCHCNAAAAGSIASLLLGSDDELPSFSAAPSDVGQSADLTLPLLDELLGDAAQELLLSGSDADACADVLSLGWLDTAGNTHNMQESGSRVCQREATGAATAGSSGPGSKGGPRKRRPRDEKQQELNRLAQQRYRDRKKAKLQSMEGTVEALSSQVETLEALKKDNASLRGRTTVLQQRVAQQEASLAQLQASSKAMQARVAEQERMLADASALIQQQAAALKDAEDELSSLRAEAESDSAESVDTKLLEPSIRAWMREVLAAVYSKELGSCCHALSCGCTIPDNLVAQICRCCRQAHSKERIARAA